MRQSPPSAPGSPVWGGDVSRALRTDSPARSAEVRVFQGAKDVQAYKF